MHTKLRVLLEGLRFDEASLHRCAGRFKADPHVYNVSQQVSDRDVPFPQELVIQTPGGLERVVVAAASYPESTILLLEDGGSWRLREPGGEEIAVTVDLPPEPRFWRRRLEDGMPFVRVLSTCGLYQANLWLWHDCALPMDGTQCRFCGVKVVESQKGASGLLHLRDVVRFTQQDGWWASIRKATSERVVQVLDAAIDEHYHDHIHLVIINGNLPPGTEDVAWLISNDLTADIQVRHSLTNLDAISLLMPPRDLSLLDEAHARGLPAVSFNLEVWGPEAFAAVCPGKAEYGRGRMLEALRHAVGVFGIGHVFTNLIVGLEPISVTREGIWALADEGIVANPVIFHRDWGAHLWRHRVDDETAILDLFREVGALYRKRNLLPPYCVNCSRTTLVHEAVLGWLG